MPLPEMQEQTLVLAGCPRDAFNGEYVKETGALFHGRPVFYCAKNTKYLFYHRKREQWQAVCGSVSRVAFWISKPACSSGNISCSYPICGQVFHKLGKICSCRLQTQQGPQTEATWGVWDREKKAGPVERSKVRSISPGRKHVFSGLKKAQLPCMLPPRFVSAVCTAVRRGSQKMP